MGRILTNLLDGQIAHTIKKWRGRGGGGGVGRGGRGNYIYKSSTVNPLSKYCRGEKASTRSNRGTVSCPPLRSSAPSKADSTSFSSDHSKSFGTTASTLDLEFQGSQNNSIHMGLREQIKVPAASTCLCVADVRRRGVVATAE